MLRKMRGPQRSQSPGVPLQRQAGLQIRILLLRMAGHRELIHRPRLAMPKSLLERLQSLASRPVKFRAITDACLGHVSRVDSGKQSAVVIHPSADNVGS